MLLPCSQQCCVRRVAGGIDDSVRPKQCNGSDAAGPLSKPRHRAPRPPKKKKPTHCDKAHSEWSRGLREGSLGIASIVHPDDCEWRQGDPQFDPLDDENLMRLLDELIHDGHASGVGSAHASLYDEGVYRTAGVEGDESMEDARHCSIQWPVQCAAPCPPDDKLMAALDDGRLAQLLDRYLEGASGNANLGLSPWGGDGEFACGEGSSAAHCGYGRDASINDTSGCLDDEPLIHLFNEHLHGVDAFNAAGAAGLLLGRMGSGRGSHGLGAPWVSEGGATDGVIGGGRLADPAKPMHDTEERCVKREERCVKREDGAGGLPQKHSRDGGSNLPRLKKSRPVSRNQASKTAREPVRNLSKSGTYGKKRVGLCKRATAGMVDAQPKERKARNQV